MSQKRRLHRRNIVYYLNVFDRKTNRILGNLVDITPEGIMLLSNEPIPENTIFDLRLQFPGDIFGEDSVAFAGESIWTRRDVNPEYYVTGFRLIDVSLDSTLLIKRLVTEYGFIS